MTCRRIILATGNPHKVSEMKQLLTGHLNPDQVCGAESVGGMPHVDEEADSFEGNALLKARALKSRTATGDCVLADDSGLVVDALHGAPGVYSARYAGPCATDEDNLRRLLHELRDVPEPHRAARFICVLAYITADGREFTFQGECHGVIVREPSGEYGFGYDPVFRPNGHTQTFADLGKSVKQKISHRARAVQRLLDSPHE